MHSARKTTPKAAAKLVAKAKKAQASGDARVAAAVFRKLIVLPRCQPGTYIAAAHAFASDGELEEARRALRKAMECGSPGDLINLRMRVGFGFFKCGDIPATHNFLSEVWDRFQNDKLAITLAETSERLGKLESGLSVVRSVKQATARAKLVEGLIIARQGGTEQALNLFNDACKRSREENDHPTGLQAGLEAAKSHDKLGDYTTAWQTMSRTREDHFPKQGLARTLDKRFREITRAGMRDLEDLLEHPPTRDNPPPPHSPVLVAGHPRSGTSVITVALAKALNRTQYDEPEAFVNALARDNKVNRPPLHLLRQQHLDTLRNDYRRRLSEFQTETDPREPMIDKNPGLEHFTPRWLAVFPDSKVLLVRRHPLDILISCLFTFLWDNPFSMQFFTPERTAAAISDSLEIQDKLLKQLPESCAAVAYEDFVRDGMLPLDQLPPPASGAPAREAALHSPNYAVANNPVFKQSVHRFEHYLGMIPADALKRLDAWIPS